MALILHNTTIIADTREQDKHIIRELEERGYSVLKQTMSFGDYSFIHKEENYSKKFVIERKKNFDEIIGNIRNKKNRIYKEFERARKNKSEIIIVIEQTKDDLINREYRSKYSPKEVYDMIQTFCYKYKAQCNLCQREGMTDHILGLIGDKFIKK